jgi:hypothetical protein
VIHEQPDYERRETLEFERGTSHQDRSSSTPDVPGRFQTSEGAPRDRLDVAKWFLRPSNLNRAHGELLLEQLFGTGIVETLEILQCG